MIFTRVTNLPLTIGFTGTQEAPTELQIIAFRKLLGMLRPDTLHHGDCIGWDAKAHEIFDRPGKAVAIHPPTNASKRAMCVIKFANSLIFPPLDYLIRNRAIVECCDLLVACPKNETGEELRSGTWSTVRYARKIHKPIIVVRPSGVYQHRYLARVAAVCDG